MKTFSLLILSSMIYLSSNAATPFAKDSIPNLKINTIYFSPFQLAHKEIAFGFEHKLSNLGSVKVDASAIWSPSNTNYYSSFNNEAEVTGTNIRLSYRRYLFYNLMSQRKKAGALWGVHISPMLHFQHILTKFTSPIITTDINGNKIGEVTPKYHQNAFAPGLLTGVRFDLAKGLITIDANIGFEAKFSKITGNAYYYYNGYYNNTGIGNFNLGYNGILPSGNLSLGFNF
jgi:hypothetical protein